MSIDYSGVQANWILSAAYTATKTYAKRPQMLMLWKVFCYTTGITW